MTMSTGNREMKGKDTISVLLRVDKLTYERLLKLKIAGGGNISLNKFLNKILSEHTVRHEVEIKGYEVNYEDFE